MFKVRNFVIKAMFVLFLLLCFACSSNTGNSGTLKPVSVNKNIKEYSYLEAKAKALEAVGLVNYNPLILNAGYSEDGYDFVFYPIELSKIFAVNVKRYTGITSARTFRNISNYSYVNADTDYVLADLALNMALDDVSVKVPNGFEYRVWMENFDGQPVYYVMFADEKLEYKYMVKARLDEAGLMSKDVVDKISKRALVNTVQ